MGLENFRRQDVVFKHRAVRLDELDLIVLLYWSSFDRVRLGVHINNTLPHRLR